jgi:addiction module toxin, txe/yoeB family
MYQIEFSEEARKELFRMMKSDIKTYKKFESLIPELRAHPYTGTGHPHQLRHVNGVWSRKLDKKNRLRYMVNDKTVVVFIVSALGHYDDK